jgi:DNA-binding LacI/PurR family transcriptional regulator
MDLTEKVRQKVVTEILDGKYSPGDKLPTERDMAEITGTSRVTVRRAYEQLENSGIITRRPSAGTCVSEAFTGNTNTIDSIAIIATLNDPFSVEFIGAVNRICSEDDILNVLGIADEEPEEQSKIAIRFAAKGIKNMIVWGFDKRFDFRIFERMRVLGINMVFFDRIIPGAFADYVGVDNHDAINVLFNKALQEKPEKCIFFDISGLFIDTNDERKKTFIELCRKKHLPYEFYSVPLHAKYHDFESAAKSFMSTVCNVRTAVFCVNDTVATSLFSHLPPNLKIYSIDGTETALEMGIVSYSQPIRKMAAATITALKNQQRLGAGWRAKKYYFKGEVSE